MLRCMHLLGDPHLYQEKICQELHRIHFEHEVVTASPCMMHTCQFWNIDRHDFPLVLRRSALSQGILPKMNPS